MKTDLLQLRVQPEEKSAFQDAANLAGIALSAWVRERLRMAARIELRDAEKQVPFIQALRANSPPPETPRRYKGDKGGLDQF